MKREFIFKDYTGSTNNDLKALINSSSSPVYTVIRADRQTGGKGRLGRSFHSPAGGLYFSAAFPLCGDEKNISALTLAAGLCVCEALEEHCKITPMIKWPNDIFVNGKKLCGILCELTGSNMRTAVVGIGINTDITADEVPPELKNTMTSLPNESIVPPDKDALMKTVIKKLDCAVYNDNVLCDITALSALIKKIRPRSYLTGKTVNYELNGKKLKGIFKTVADTGEAIVTDGNGKDVTVFFGEIGL